MGKTTRTLKEWAIKGIGAGAGIAVAIIVVNATAKAFNIGASAIIPGNPLLRPPELYTNAQQPRRRADQVFFATGAGIGANPSGVPGYGSVKFYTNV